METFDIEGENPLRAYTWKGGPCRTRKRLLAELAKRKLTLPAAATINDPCVWAEFAQRLRGPANRG